MKKIILSLCFLISVNCCYATQYETTISKLENSLFGFTYSGDDLSRVTRLENSIYGQSKNGDLNTRITKLQKDMSADSIGQEITPKEDTFADDEMYYPHDKNIAQNNSLPPSGSNVDYPSINELESEIFKTEYKHKDLATRLMDLEKKALGKTYESESFATRVERLQAKIKPRSFMNNSLAQSSNDFYDGDVIPLEKDYYLDEYSAPDFDYDAYNAMHKPPSAKVNIASVEKLMYKKTYNNDDLDTRLSRLESTMFGTTFKEDSQEERLNRIASAYKATKSATKYDSNKFTQNMATAMQIGTLILMILACVL